MKGCFGAINVENEIEIERFFGTNIIKILFHSPWVTIQKPHSFFAAFISSHKKFQVHIGGAIMVSRMSCWSFVSLIMYIMVHMEQRCIWSDMFCCDFRK